VNRFAGRACIGAAVTIWLSLSAAHAADEPLRLECTVADDTKETKLIAQRASSVVSRPAPGKLVVRVAGKTLKFDDDPVPEMGSRQYRFCDRQEGWILLEHDEDMVFSGVLINEATGVMLPCGQQVLFSLDRRAYFDAFQPNGLDGEVWEIRFADGRQSWTGYNFIEKDKGSIYAPLLEPRWLPSGQFVAIAHCLWNHDETWQATLTKKDGRWDWQPVKRCPKSPR
jgi:hypothetical protein